MTGVTTLGLACAGSSCAEPPGRPEAVVTSDSESATARGQNEDRRGLIRVSGFILRGTLALEISSHFSNEIRIHEPTAVASAYTGRPLPRKLE